MRRLVQIELSDVDVPKRAGDPDVALFVRVLAAGEGRIRVELWERGEDHGARLVSGTRGGSQLTARRVALAAAELARGLRDKRRAAERERAAEERRKRLADEAERRRTLDGPRALRPAFSAMFVGPGELTLYGPSVAGQFHVVGRTRLDASASFALGPVCRSDATAEVYELGVGPGYRLPIPELSLDLDVSAFARAGVLSFANVAAVDGIAGQKQTWWARAGAGAAAELRLSRTTRLSAGFAIGAVLRRVPVTFESGGELRTGGLFLGADLGIVFTPAVAR